MRILIRMRRALNRLAPDDRAMQRLARRQAFQMSGAEIENFEVQTIPEESGAYVTFRHPDFFERFMVWTPTVPASKTLRVSCSPTPERRLILVFGRDDYQLKPDAYLRVA